MKLSATLLFLSALSALGCMGEKRTYMVSIKNETSRPITIGLVKDAPPYNDENWVSPEDLAILKAHSGDQMWGVLVPPGKTGTTPPTEARFSNDGNAWLRVYAGEPTFSELLAMSRGSPNRLDIRLHPGANYFSVTGTGGALNFDPIKPGTMPAANK